LQRGLDLRPNGRECSEVFGIAVIALWHVAGAAM